MTARNVVAVPRFVPPAVARFYRELLQEEGAYSAEERACLGRLVSDDRMREVYGELHLSEPGWRLFLDIAWNHAFLRLRELREERRKVRKLLVEISVRAGELADRLQRFGDLRESAGLESAHVDIAPLVHTLDLLEVADEGNGHFLRDVSPRLREMRRELSSASKASIPSPATLVGVIARRADALMREGLEPADKVITDAISGREHSDLGSYRKTVLGACEELPELERVLSISDGAFAALACVALGEDFTEDAVKKQRQRDNPRE